MIKINKFEHVYGIKKLNNPTLIDSNTLIYSPNGVMKSSFADGLFEISKNRKPKDVFNNIESSFEVENNGLGLNEMSALTNLDLLIFKGEDIFDSIFNDSEIAKIVVSPLLKKQYETKVNSIKDKIDLIKAIISVKILDEKKPTKNSKIDSFLSEFNGNTEIDRITNMLSTNHDEIVEDVSTLSYTDIFNTKTESILSDSSFKKKAEEYQKLKDVKLNEKIFSGGFGIQELQDMITTSKKTKYFAAGHKLFINNQSLDEEAVEILLTSAVSEAYGSEEMRTAFQNAKTILEKNTDSRKIVSAMKSHSWLLEKLVDPIKFKRALMFKKLEDDMSSIIEAKKVIDEARRDIEEIFKDAKKTNPIWEKVLHTFNQRFSNKHFDMSIVNQANAVIGIQQPVFVKVLKGTTTEINQEIFDRFSSGEKRAIFILYFLFEIELKNTTGLNYTIVVDDIVDSFDYKNKYAMIEYLSDLADNSNVQLIILTHNFDFFRSCKHRFGHLINSKLFAYTDTNDEVILFEAHEINYEPFKLYKSWKNRNDELSLITILPFLRNLVEIKEGTSHVDYSKLSNYLHFNLNTGSVDLMHLSNIFAVNNIAYSTLTANNYWQLLITKVKSIIYPVKESDIQTKILLGLFIRLASDYLLLTKYRLNNSGNDPIITGRDWTRGLRNQSLCYLTNEETNLYNRAITVSPSFVHVNSFMYEPLIDIGTERLLNVANELILVNAL